MLPFSKADQRTVRETLAQSDVKAIKTLAVKVFYPNRILSSTTTRELLDDISMSLESGIEIVLIDLQNVSFMDSNGLGTLALACQKVRKAGKRFVICSAYGQAKMILEMSGMERIFENYVDRTEFNRVVLHQPVV
ncbi:MAG: STAS domain-containing protein [Scytolyngbya sp. HA4215-MV1]|jgi:anti-anti-sigma factor|nr:STAS domain-containing protein [Scytolyngbya sp. HA4215-MV1]